MKNKWACEYRIVETLFQVILKINGVRDKVEKKLWSLQLAIKNENMEHNYVEEMFQELYYVV